MVAYLVTGGCGFIGSHLCEALVREGARVRVLDDLSTGSLDNIPPGVEVVRGDVADRDTVVAAMRDVDGCFHLAAVASVERSRQDWLGAHRTNVTGAVAVFDAARQVGRQRPVPVVYASSAAVYGNSATMPIREDAEKQPSSAYGADKYGCELHARIASELHGVPTIGLRFFNVYGPRQDPKSPYSGVISIFCDRLRRGLPIQIFGDGSQTRDFIFVEDVVTALLASMLRPPAAPAVFNVCSGRQTSVLELALMISRLCGHRPEIHHLPTRSGEIVHSFGDCSAARQQLGLPAPSDLRVSLWATLFWMEALERPRRLAVTRRPSAPQVALAG
ncbi:MAG TPA: NAD-dependent epimerase/dehydratase family protein [Stellaceae bacterium]|nr:NAD-dependent epimerase/dehydratase family protein [Stellaceae bacterium]